MLISLKLIEAEEAVFEKAYENYLAHLKDISFESIPPNLGGNVEGANKYMDAECIAMLGWQLFNHLRKADKK